jgi:hypothetical protein
MSNQSTKLSLPYIQPSQAQKHVTHNEALRRLDTFVQLSVRAIGTTTPPAAPENGDIHALGANATSAWAGQDGKLACYADGAWDFFTPQDGWRAWNLGDGTLNVFSSGAWLPVVPPLQNLDGLGVGTSSDATNRLAVASDAALFSHAGTDHRVVVNKAGAADTASILMQSAWSGRAEIGLTGDEDLHFRVSPDSSAWTSALILRHDDGLTDAKCLRSGLIEIDSDSVGYIPTPGSGGMLAVTSVHPSYPQAGFSGLYTYDTGPSLLLLDLASGPDLENLNTTALAGTTGTDGKVSIGVRSGEIQIENRHNASLFFSYTFLNTY